MRSTPKPAQDYDKYILRFEQPGHRDRLKAIALREKRSLNKQILLLIEAGEAAMKKSQLGEMNGEGGHGT